MDVSRVDVAALRLRVSVLVESGVLDSADPNRTEHYVYRSPAGDSASTTCTDEDVETRAEPILKTALTQRVGEWLRHFGEPTGDTIKLGPALPGAVLEYSLSAGASPDKVCWRSIFRASDGTTVYSFRYYVCLRRRPVPSCASGGEEFLGHELLLLGAMAAASRALASLELGSRVSDGLDRGILVASFVEFFLPSYFHD